MTLDNLRGGIMMNLRIRRRTEKFGEITCLKPANWQITNDESIMLKIRPFYCTNNTNLYKSVLQAKMYFTHIFPVSFSYFDTQV